MSKPLQAIIATAISGLTLAGTISFSGVENELPDGAAFIPAYEETYQVGELKVFHYEDFINLHSDRRNLSMKESITLPAGWVIENVTIEEEVRRHTVTSGVSFFQPASLSVNMDNAVAIRNATEEGFLSGSYMDFKADAKGELSNATSNIAHSFAVDANSHATIHVKAWADGRRYSSRDGWIRADIVVTARYVASAQTIDAGLIGLAKAVTDASADVMRAYAKDVKRVAASNNAANTTNANQANPAPVPVPAPPEKPEPAA